MARTKHSAPTIDEKLDRKRKQTSKHISLPSKRQGNKLDFTRLAQQDLKYFEME
jgi:hypothetical protein